MNIYNKIPNELRSQWICKSMVIKDAVKLWRLGRRYKALSAKRSPVFSLVFNVLAND